MAYFMDFSKPVVSRSSTKIVLRGESANEFVHVTGTGFTFNAQGILTAGTITGMSLYLGTTLLETTSIVNYSAASLYTNILSKAGPVISQVASWNLAAGSDSFAPVITATQIKFKLTDNTFVQILGTFKFDAEGEPAGTVTAIKHLAANGTTVLHQATGLPLAAELAFMALFETDTVSRALLTGTNTVRAMTAGDLHFLDGGPGNDTIAGHVTGTRDTVWYGDATSAVTVNLAFGTATGGGGSDKLYYIEHVNGSNFGDTITGSAQHNALFGGLGNDTILGGAGTDDVHGGKGHDTLNGGPGSDTMYGDEPGYTGYDIFIFANTPNATANSDLIGDFNAAYDTIKLENSLFTALGPATGTLAASKFYASTNGLAHDADDRIIYNKTTGALFYDTNGSAAGGSVQFATLLGAPAINYVDFIVI